MFIYRLNCLPSFIYGKVEVMSVLTSTVIRGFAQSGYCINYLACSYLFKNHKLSVFPKNVYENLLHREIHISSIGLVLEKPIDPNLLSNKGKQKSEVQAPARPIKEKEIYITLIGVDNKITVTTQKDALKLSTRRDLKLVKVKDYDTKSQRPTYQLMTTSQYLLEDVKENQIKGKKKDSFLKGEKVLSLSHKINEHDLISKINMMKKWVAKRYEVRIIITGEDSNARVSLIKM